MPLGVRYAVTLAGVLAAYSMSHAVTAFIRRGAIDLNCVECESHRVRAADLGYRVVRCRRCGNTWNAGEQQPDPTVFD